MDYFTHGNRRRGNTVSEERLNAPLPNGGRRPGPSSRENLRTPSSIRIRRLPSNQSVRPESGYFASNGPPAEQPSNTAIEDCVANRRRSSSAPQSMSFPTPEPDLARQSTIDHPMQTITEGRPAQMDGPPVLPGIGEQTGPLNVGPQANTLGVPPEAVEGATAMHSAGNAARTNRGLRRYRSGQLPPRRGSAAANSEYSADMVDFLDLMDPEVQTLGTLTNVQNSLFVPDLGRFLNRRPTYDLTRRPGTASGQSITPRSRAGTMTGAQPALRARTNTFGSRPISAYPRTGAREDKEGEALGGSPETLHSSGGADRRISITSELTESHFAVLPHGVTLDSWSDEDIAELNDHVRHALHSRREGFKRGWHGFLKYISKPLGLFVFIYATLVTLFGAAWVIFLIGWIYVGHKQLYAVNVIDNILVALFALMGDGLAPFRVIDTYHMCFIAHYHHLTWRLRQEKKMPKLPDHNDLPRISMDVDLEAAGRTRDDLEENQEYSVLSPVQQRRLEYHQAKFNKSHTFYKPHETATHHAFPLRLLVAVVVLLDCHSLFQVALGTCTWSINYKTRPEALTASILCCSITCNIVAGILVSIGDRRTRKKDVLERLFRQDLTREAIKEIQKERDISGPCMEGCEDESHGHEKKVELHRHRHFDHEEHERHDANGPKDEAATAATGVEV